MPTSKLLNEITRDSSASKCFTRIAFYDSHVSGELSSRLINDSQALSSLTQFTTQHLGNKQCLPGSSESEPTLQTLLGHILNLFGTCLKHRHLSSIIRCSNVLYDVFANA